MLHVCALLGLLTVPAVAAAPERDNPPRHNIVLFVADGLRASSVNINTTPTLWALAAQGVWLRNSHSVFPTVTTTNASAIATGHYPGDTGDYGNFLYTAFAAAGDHCSVVPYIESNAVLGELDAHFGDYLNEQTVLALARRMGYSTAIVGKQGPALIFDHTERSGQQTMVIDDASGTAQGIPLAPELIARLQAAGLPIITPGRGANASSGTHSANLLQQDYLVSAVTRALLPLLADRHKPFVLVFWSRDPDATQHNQGDSPQALTPGINGLTSLAAIRNADDDLERIRACLFQLGLADSTNIVVTSDHGFSTIAKSGSSSASAAVNYPDVPAGFLPPGFLALDLGRELNLKVFDTDSDYAVMNAGMHPKKGNALLGRDRDHPRIIIGANNGTDLVYVKPASDRGLLQRIANVLLQKDYVSGLFVDERVAAVKGALTLADIALSGNAVTPRPSMVVNFRSFDTGCGEPTRCGVVVADTPLLQGQGTHGSLSRAETNNFMALIGPDFKQSFVDDAPASNADLGRTIVSLIGAPFVDRGARVGRVLSEAMPGGALPAFRRERRKSQPAANGLQTLLDLQWIGTTRYVDAGGFLGRTVGLAADAPTD
jgi:hypothetical protein